MIAAIYEPADGRILQSVVGSEEAIVSTSGWMRKPYAIVRSQLTPIEIDGLDQTHRVDIDGDGQIVRL